MIPATDAGEQYSIGHMDGLAQGRAQARGEIVAGILARATLEERRAMGASVVSLRAAASANAAWLRQIATAVRAGEL